MLKMKRQTMLLLAIGLIDLMSTLWLLDAHDAAEANPLMAFFLAQGTCAFIAAKLALLVLPLALLEWAWHRRPHFVRRAANTAILTYLAFYLFGVAHANVSPYLARVEGYDPVGRVVWARIERRIAMKRAARKLHAMTSRQAAPSAAEREAARSNGFVPST